MEMSKKSPFISLPIRKLSKVEKSLYKKANLVVKGKVFQIALGTVSSLASYDGRSRPLILHADIIRKIELGHGKIVLENLIISINDWDYILKNVDGNKDKINLIKKIPHTPYFLTVGANRINGFFIVTHYESRPKKHNTLKNLLRNKGDFLENTEEAALSHLQLSRDETAS